MNTITGSCNCDAIKVTIPTPPAGSLGLCHCTSCRKSSGTVAGYNLAVKQDDLKVEGEPKEFIEVGVSGGNVWRHFCPTCGSPLYDRDTLEPDMRWVKAGLFEPGTLPKPTRQIFTKNCEEWERLYSGVEENKEQ